jgi:hypothetical protein
VLSSGMWRSDIWYKNIGVLEKNFVWCSWVRASWYNYENNQQDELYRLIYYYKSALHVSGDVFAHHQEPLDSIYSIW